MESLKFGLRAIKARLSLRNQIYLILLILVGITFTSCLVIVWHNYRIEKLLYSIIEEDLPEYQIAEKLELALINQKGFVSYYFLDKDPIWLKKLGEHRQIFRENLKDAALVSRTPEEKAILTKIQQQYLQYIELKDQVIFLYKTKENIRGSELHKLVRKMFFDILNDCERYKAVSTAKMTQSSQNSYKEAEKLRMLAGTLVIIISLLSFFLVLILVKRILGPLRRMTLESNQKSIITSPIDEVESLSQNIEGLISDIGQKETILKKSRKHLEQSEKMALVGKLAAGMAHSVRNPLTSIKMRLFSLGRTVELSKSQKEDFNVISEEIQHVDIIVQNFLEFSRPPKLNFQKISPSAVVDLSLQLLEHRLKSYEVSVTVIREKPLPEFDGDPEQLKEVIVNLITNSCEAMIGGGEIIIEEKESTNDNQERVLILKLQDNGPGIPDAIQKKVFQPFFTTKDEGTGLGLSIAASIIKEHNGYLACTSELGKGTTFTINFIIYGDRHEHGINH